MRFSIRDLLLWTTIAAIYAAWVGALNSRGLLDFKTDIFSSYLVIALIAFLAFRYLFAIIRSGRFCLSFKRKQSYWEYAILICLPGIITGGMLVMKNPMPIVLLIILLLGPFASAVSGDRIRLGRFGVVYRSSFYSWEDHRFELITSTNHLRITPLSSDWWYWRKSLAIPNEHVEEVRSILEAKQGATDA